MDISKNIHQEIRLWQKSTNEITEQWIREYFDWSEDEEVYFEWVSDEPGGVFNFSDYWFSFDNVLDCYKHKITREQLFTWYDYCLENQFVNISLAQFILSPEEKLKKEEENLQKSKERVNLAEQEFKKAL